MIFAHNKIIECPENERDVFFFETRESIIHFYSVKKNDLWKR